MSRWKQERASDVSKSTVNRELNIIRGCFSRAVDWGGLALSLLRSVKAYKVDDSRIRVLNDDELRMVLTAPAEVALLCRVTLISLNRISEVLGLRREHLGASWMEVCRKGGRVHRIALPEDLRVSLLERCAPSGYIFGEGPQGEPPSQQTASNRVIRTLASLGLSGVTHHTMRHTGVTLMLEAGINPVSFNCWRAGRRCGCWNATGTRATRKSDARSNRTPTVSSRRPQNGHSQKKAPWRI